MQNEVTITNQEIQKYEPLIYKILHKEIFKYWGKNGEGLLPRLGIDKDDLVQMGRIWIFDQLKWYKRHGNKKKAKLITVLYNYLRNKYISISITACRNKRGGNIFHIDEAKLAIDKYLSCFDLDCPTEKNKTKILAILSKYSMLTLNVKNSILNKNDNNKLIKYVEHINGNIDPVSHVDYNHYCVSESSSVHSNHPEQQLLFKEEVQGKINSLRRVYKQKLLPPPESLEDCSKTNIRQAIRSRNRDIFRFNKLLNKICNFDHYKAAGLTKREVCSIMYDYSISSVTKDKIEQIFNMPLSDIKNLIKHKEK